jgi:hypothetical protein
MDGDRGEGQRHRTGLVRQHERPCRERRLERVAAGQQRMKRGRRAAEHRGDAAGDKAVGHGIHALGPAGLEVTCEQCFELLLDQYVEREVADADADAPKPRPLGRPGLSLRDARYGRVRVPGSPVGVLSGWPDGVLSG